MYPTPPKTTSPSMSLPGVIRLVDGADDEGAAINARSWSCFSFSARLSLFHPSTVAFPTSAILSLAAVTAIKADSFPWRACFANSSSQLLEDMARDVADKRTRRRDDGAEGD